MIDNSLVPTAERTLRLIELLLNEKEGLTPQELLMQLDISRSSLFMLLRTLKGLGYIEQAEKRGRYRLGPRLASWQIPQNSPASQDLLSAFYQEAERAELPETMALAGISGGEVFILAQVESNQQVRSVFAPGQIHAGSTAAKEVLAPIPAPDVSANGYSLSLTNESLELALPVCRDGRHPDSALLLSAPAYRWETSRLLKELLPLLREMAARLSYHLGAVTYSPYHDTADLLHQPTAPLSMEDTGAFLQGPWAARLACVRPDGHPHVIPVWQEWDGEAFYVIAWEGSQWVDFVKQNPNVSLTVDEPWPPLRRIVARGSAEIFSGEGVEARLDALVQRMAGRYLGRGKAGLVGKIQSAFRIVPVFMSGRQGLPGLNRKDHQDED